MKWLTPLGKTIVNILLLMFSLSAVFPIIWMLYSSFKTQKEFTLNTISLPETWQFSNYIEAIQVGKLHEYFFNSVYISLSSVFLIIFLGFIIAYMIARFSFPGRKVIYILFMFGMLIPIHGLLVPIFIEFKNVGLLNKPYTLILPYVAFGLPIVIFLFESFIKQIPKEIDEAAIMDGCTTFQVIFKIIFPVASPVIATAVILSFLTAWNEFPFALVLIQDEALRTLPVGLTNFNGQYTVNYPQMMAAMSITVLPVLLIYLAFYKKIIQGMTAGSVKG
ncbi:sugar ABC transporter permease [Halolactibacillus miurensis]|uniref:Raffinose/stachyose/melibiose transport system permease protein n=1 Tax=Halolactibacillus miurensis TaxID=306541 RepID=A0A1I6NYU4_9BACI|nr:MULTISPECIES: carbohydrate ABC transporter permease [Halolactibacillus]GEM04781.1 sugar ABC transporter permease [Halolactibacillus miurensis]SFS33025.1 raffinose/stachyose/melibiose transport system permease protein [Halolactibacillus miurensis]